MISNLEIKFAVARTVMISDFEASLIVLLEEFQLRYFDLPIFSQRFESPLILSSIKLYRAVVPPCSRSFLQHSFAQSLF